MLIQPVTFQAMRMPLAIPIRPSGVSLPSLIQDGLVAEFRFDDGNGQVLTDYKNSNNGQLGSTAGSDSNDPTWTAEGQSFDGGDFNKINAAGQALGTGSFTVCLAVRNTSASGTRVAFGGEANKFAVIYTSGTYATMFLYTTGGNVLVQTLDITVLGVGVDRFWALQFESGVAGRNYHGDAGSLVLGKQTNTANTTLVASTAFHLGSRTVPDLYWLGNEYYAALYNRALSLAELEETYTTFTTILAARGVTLE